MSRRYQTYPEYKDSGIKWIGNIPESWDMWKIAHACPYVASGTTPKTDSDLYYGGDNLWVTTGELREGIIVDTKKHITDQAILDMPTLKIHPIGSVVIAMYGATIGRLGIFGKEATTNQACCVMPPSKILNNKYLFYWLYATRQEIINLSSGGGQPNVNQEKISALKVSTPDAHEQTQIATFLDRETQKIDRLIERQQQLIKLLQEKRQAVISHAVTKGLNPDAKMKDSGVEWLGEIPEHWEMVPLKYSCNFCGGGTPAKDNLSYWIGGNIPWVSPKDMKFFWITDSQDKLTVKAVEESSTNFVECGALLMVVRSGILQRTIPIAINTVEVTLNQDMKALKFNKRMNVEYAANYILGNVPSLLLEWSKEGATVESIEQEYLSASLFPVPPLDEQLGINDELSEKIAILQKLVDRVADGMALLKERRTALISAAVTGKIDVRNITMDNTGLLEVC